MFTEKNISFMVVFSFFFLASKQASKQCSSYNNVLVLPENKDILLLFVSIGSVKFTDGQVEKWFIIVGCGLVSCVLVETDLSLFEHAEQINPRLAAVGVKG